MIMREKAAAYTLLCACDISLCGWNVFFPDFLNSVPKFCLQVNLVYVINGNCPFFWVSLSSYYILLCFVTFVNAVQRVWRFIVVVFADEIQIH